MPVVPNVATVVVVGFGLVLAILVALVLILSIQGKFFQNIDKNKSTKAQKVVKAAAVVPVTPPLPRPHPMWSPASQRKWSWPSPLPLPLWRAAAITRCAP